MSAQKPFVRLSSCFLRATSRQNQKNGAMLEPTVIKPAIGGQMN